MLGTSPDAPPPSAWHVADSIAALAVALSMPPAAFERSVTTMNDAAAQGTDLEFDRGGDAHQRFNGDAGHAPNPCLGRIAEPPFHAVSIRPGLCSTKGGLDVDADARVLGRDGRPVPGLFACGDVAATVMGYGYAGAGASIGPAMTFGMLAAEAIVRGTSLEDMTRNETRRRSC